MLMMKCTRMFHARTGVIHVRTLWSQKVFSNVWLKKCFKKRLQSQTVYLICFQKCNLYCIFLNCSKQGVGSTVDWKPRLRHYKSHIKKKVRSCSIVNHFIDVFIDADDPSRNIRFIIIDQLNNKNSLSPDEIIYKKKDFGFQRLFQQHT